MNEGWFERRTHQWTQWAPHRLAELKEETGTTVSLVVPARDEEATVGRIVARVREELVENLPLLDEIVVMDSDSTDATARVAAEAGARVHRTVDVRPDLGHYRGKGEALWKSQFVTGGEVLVFLDADLVEWDTHFVSGLLGPLLEETGVELVKAFYDRVLAQEGDHLAGAEARNGPRPAGDGDLPARSVKDPAYAGIHSATTEPATAATGADGGAVSAHGGGRVTELVARPTIALRWPALSGVVQPLSGEWAIRRSLLRELPVPVGYGVELATLVDTYLSRGVEAIAQVGMGRRGHHHQSLHGLGAMATELLAVADRRAGTGPGPGADTVRLHQYTSGGRAMTTEVGIVQREPACRVGPPPAGSADPDGARSREAVGRC